MRVECKLDEVFDKWPLTSVVIRQFDPASKQAALAYGTWLNERLAATGVIHPLCRRLRAPRSADRRSARHR